MKTSSYIPHCGSQIPNHKVVTNKPTLLNAVWEEHSLSLNIKLYCSALTKILIFEEELHSCVVQEKFNAMTPQS